MQALIAATVQARAQVARHRAESEARAARARALARAQTAVYESEMEVVGDSATALAARLAADRAATLKARRQRAEVRGRYRGHSLGCALFSRWPKHNSAPPKSAGASRRDRQQAGRAAMRRCYTTASGFSATCRWSGSRRYQRRRSSCGCSSSRGGCGDSSEECLEKPHASCLRLSR